MTVLIKTISLVHPKILRQKSLTNQVGLGLFTLRKYFPFSVFISLVFTLFPVTKYLQRNQWKQCFQLYSVWFEKTCFIVFIFYFIFNWKMVPCFHSFIYKSMKTEAEDNRQQKSNFVIENKNRKLSKVNEPST